MALRRAIAPILTFSLLLIGSIANAFSIEEYDANIAKALKGEFIILNSLQTNLDFGTENNNLNSLLKALHKRFGDEGFATFLSTKGNALDISGFHITSEGVRGEGGFGKVFALSAQSKTSLAKSVKNIKKVRFDIAIKMLKETPIEKSEKYDLEVELNNMKFLSTTKSDDGIAFAVPYYGAFMDKSGQVFILTQLMSESLSDYTNPEKVLDSADIDRLITSLGAALAKWHSLGFVHSDVKSDNIMRDSNGDFYFIDFGTTRKLTPAQMIDAKARVDNLSAKVYKLVLGLGTNAMRGPEKAVKNPSLLGSLNWGASDTYAFGMTLFAVLSHRSEGQLLEACASGGACSERFLTSDMTEDDFNAFRTFVQGIIPIGPRDSRTIKAAKRLVMRLLTWRPSDRPSNILTAYHEELR